MFIWIFIFAYSTNSAQLSSRFSGPNPIEHSTFISSRVSNDVVSCSFVLPSRHSAARFIRKFSLDSVEFFDPPRSNIYTLSNKVESPIVSARFGIGKIRDATLYVNRFIAFFSLVFPIVRCRLEQTNKVA
jgi:hypothetical protein